MSVHVSWYDGSGCWRMGGWYGGREVGEVGVVKLSTSTPVLSFKFFCFLLLFLLLPIMIVNLYAICRCLWSVSRQC